MPLGYKLEVSEREVLYQRLIQEYFATDEDNPGILKSWLLRGLRNSGGEARSSRRLDSADGGRVRTFGGGIGRRIGISP